MGKKYTLEDTPQFSPWPSRLLGLERFGKRIKSPEEVHREYQLEKWGSLLEQLSEQRSGASLRQVDQWFKKSSGKSLCWINNEFKLLTSKASSQYYIDLIEEEINRYLPAPDIVELGCGYGSIILKLTKRKSLFKCGFKAAEYTEAGRILTKKISIFENDPVEVGWCDLSTKKITDLEIPQGSIIFTSFAAFYIKQFKPFFVDAISRFNPKAIIHFEPLIEDCTDDSLLSLMRKKYIELNGYNVNLFTMLKKAEESKKIKILKKTQPIFGENPFLACSILTWKPNSKIN